MSWLLGVARLVRSRWFVVCFACGLVVALPGCDYIRSALPPTPSPFPTLARLPTVTPVTPSATHWPTRTPRPRPTATVTPSVPLLGTVAVGANVRLGPGIDFAIITSVLPGNEVDILGQNGNWYKIITPDGTEGWMSAQVLEVAPEVAESVPVIELNLTDVEE
jgi:hypothetical protein